MGDAIKARTDDDLSFFEFVQMNKDTGTLRVNQWVWDTDTTAWVRMTQPQVIADDLTVSMADVERLLADNYWNDERIEYTSNQPDYIGKNTTHKAAEAATTWYIWKYTWSSVDCVRIEGPLTGSWTGRAALAWAT